MHTYNLLKREEFWLQIVLIALACIVFSFDIARPLVDYDEATYAQVTVESLKSGNLANFQLHGDNWINKPPLLIWPEMTSISIFGENEIAFRLPIVLASILCCWLVYKIVFLLTRNPSTSALGFLVLLTSNSFFLFARELRADAELTATILLALFFYLRGREDKKYWFWILPSIALGFLIKSIIVFLAVPIIAIYSWSRSDWRYLRDSYFWYGAIVAFIIAMPWHVYEFFKLGKTFWDQYVMTQIVGKLQATQTGTDNYYDYLIILYPWYFPWNFVVLMEIGGILGLNLRKGIQKLSVKDTLIPLSIVVAIVGLFTIAKTHLGTYILPAFPFFAIAIAVAAHQISNATSGYIKHAVNIFFSVAVAGGLIFCIWMMPAKVPPYTYDEMMSGKAYRADGHTDVPLYLFDWIGAETVNYYGSTRSIPFNPVNISGKVMKGPFYYMIQTIGLNYFFRAESGKLVVLYPGMRLVYLGKNFSLMYSDRDQVMPQFQFNNPQ